MNNFPKVASRKAGDRTRDASVTSLTHWPLHYQATAVWYGGAEGGQCPWCKMSHILSSHETAIEVITTLTRQTFKTPDRTTMGRFVRNALMSKQTIRTRPDEAGCSGVGGTTTARRTVEQKSDTDWSGENVFNWLVLLSRSVNYMRLSCCLISKFIDIRQHAVIPYTNRVDTGTMDVYETRPRAQHVNCRRQ